MHVFELISFESQQKCWHQNFPEKEGKDISSHISLEFAFFIQKSKHIYKNLKDTW